MDRCHACSKPILDGAPVVFMRHGDGIRRMLHLECWGEPIHLNTVEARDASLSQRRRAATARGRARDAIDYAGELQERARRRKSDPPHLAEPRADAADPAPGAGS
jgi:hypothetical protein